jgi:hypothetical protein
VRRGGAGAARGAGSKRRVAATSAAVAVAVFISPGLAADAEAHLVVDLEVLEGPAGDGRLVGAGHGDRIRSPAHARTRARTRGARALLLRAAVAVRGKRTSWRCEEERRRWVGVGLATTARRRGG